MSDRKELLQERYEDALFALLMEDMAAVDGEALLEENERLKNDPAAQVPEELDKRCEKVIRRHFAKETAHSAGRITVKSLKRVAAAVGIAAVLFISAFAVSETVRVNTLNLVVKVFGESTDLFIETGQFGVLPEVNVGWVPDDYTLEDHGQTELNTWYQYRKSKTESIIIMYSLSSGSVVSIDTENADVEYIEIHDTQAMQVTKGNRLQIVWATNDKTAFVSVVAENTPLADVIKVAKNLKFSSEDRKTDNRVQPIQIGWLPNDYKLMAQNDSLISVWYQYGKSEQEYVEIEYTNAKGTVLSIDTEDAEVDYIEVQGSQAIWVNKNGEQQMVWTTNDKSAFISLVAEGISRDDLIRIAEDLKY